MAEAVTKNRALRRQLREHHGVLFEWYAESIPVCGDQSPVEKTCLFWRLPVRNMSMTRH